MVERDGDGHDDSDFPDYNPLDEDEGLPDEVINETAERLKIINESDRYLSAILLDGTVNNQGEEKQTKYVIEDRRPPEMGSLYTVFVANVYVINNEGEKTGTVEIARALIAPVTPGIELEEKHIQEIIEDSLRQAGEKNKLEEEKITWGTFRVLGATREQAIRAGWWPRDAQPQTNLVPLPS